MVFAKIVKYVNMEKRNGMFAPSCVNESSTITKLLDTITMAQIIVTNVSNDHFPWLPTRVSAVHILKNAPLFLTSINCWDRE